MAIMPETAGGYVIACNYDNLGRIHRGQSMINVAALCMAVLFASYMLLREFAEVISRPLSVE
jgi:hypothetical protein